MFDIQYIYQSGKHSWIPIHVHRNLPQISYPWQQVMRDCILDKDIQGPQIEKRFVKDNSKERTYKMRWHPKETVSWLLHINRLRTIYIWDVGKEGTVWQCPGDIKKKTPIICTIVYTYSFTMFTDYILLLLLLLLLTKILTTELIHRTHLRYYKDIT